MTKKASWHSAELVWNFRPCRTARHQRHRSDAQPDEPELASRHCAFESQPHLLRQRLDGTAPSVWRPSKDFEGIRLAFTAPQRKRLCHYVAGFQLRPARFPRSQKEHRHISEIDASIKDCSKLCIRRSCLARLVPQRRGFLDAKCCNRSPHTPGSI